MPLNWASPQAPVPSSGCVLWQSWHWSGADAELGTANYSQKPSMNPSCFFECEAWLRQPHGQEFCHITGKNKTWSDILHFTAMFDLQMILGQSSLRGFSGKGGRKRKWWEMGDNCRIYLQRQRGWTHRTLGLLAAWNMQCPRKDSVFLTKHSSCPLLQHRWWVFNSPCLCQGGWAGFQDESSALAAKTGTFCWDAEQAIKNTKHLVTFIKCIK